MEKVPKIKIVGGKNLPSHWERFDRLQRTAQVLLSRPVSPKGVFRFKTFEEFNNWKENLHRQDHAFAAEHETDLPGCTKVTGRFEADH